MVVTSGRHARLRQTAPRHARPADRHVKAVRRWLAVFALVILIPVTTAAVMLGQHGFSFFVFRASGIGESGDSNLAENQGPGQPAAPLPPSIVAVTPTGVQLTVPGVARDAWAGVAELRGGTWVLLDAGQRYTEVRAATSRMWDAHSMQYASPWLILPVEEQL